MSRSLQSQERSLSLCDSPKRRRASKCRKSLRRSKLVSMPVFLPSTVARRGQTGGSRSSTGQPWSDSISARRLKRLVWLLILLLVLVGLPGSAEAKTEGDVVVVPLLEGEPAPFTGDLFPIRLALDFGLKLELCQERTAAEVSRLVRIHAIELQALEDKNQIREDANRAQIVALQNSIESQFYREPWFVATLSIVVTVGALLVSLYAYDAIAGGLR